MAAYNTITVTRLAPCTHCADEGPIRLQFAYGDTWQHNYALGDSIRWGGNDYGQRNEHAEILAYPERCLVCAFDTPGEYVLTVDQDRLTAYRLARSEDGVRLEAAGTSRRMNVTFRPKFSGIWRGRFGSGYPRPKFSGI